jgi:hypothetical protein
MRTKVFLVELIANGKPARAMPLRAELLLSESERWSMPYTIVCHGVAADLDFPWTVSIRLWGPASGAVVEASADAWAEGREVPEMEISSAEHQRLIAFVRECLGTVHWKPTCAGLQAIEGGASA